MVTVRGVEARLINAENRVELIKAVGNELKNFDGFSPDYVLISDTEAIIYHDEIEEEQHEWDGRYCCECDHYDWGKGCPFRKGHVTLKMDACSHFNIYL